MGTLFNNSLFNYTIEPLILNNPGTGGFPPNATSFLSMLNNPGTGGFPPNATSFLSMLNNPGTGGFPPNATSVEESVALKVITRVDIRSINISLGFKFFIS